MKSKNYSWIYAFISIIFYLEFKFLDQFPIGVLLFIAPLIRVVDHWSQSLSWNGSFQSLLITIGTISVLNVVFFNTGVADSLIYTAKQHRLATVLGDGTEDFISNFLARLVAFIFKREDRQF